MRKNRFQPAPLRYNPTRALARIVRERLPRRSSVRPAQIGAILRSELPRRNGIRGEPLKPWGSTTSYIGHLCWSAGGRSARSPTRGRAAKKLKIRYKWSGRGFEPRTPCAQNRFRCFAEGACFLMLTFQAHAASLLKLIEWFGIWRLWTATFLSTSVCGGPLP